MLTPHANFLLHCATSMTNVQPHILVIDDDASITHLIADYLGDKQYFTGDRLRSLDASVYSTVKHIALQPHPWPGKGYVQSKPNLVGYLDRGHDWGDGGLVAALDRIAASTDRKALTRGLVDRIRARLRGAP